MPDIELQDIHWPMLINRLELDFLTIDVFRAWLQKELPTALKFLRGEALDLELSNVMMRIKAEGGMRNMLQRLADNPPGNDTVLTTMIYVFTCGNIQAHPVVDHGGLLDTPPYMKCFVTDRPFVNRLNFRDQLIQLDRSPPGAKNVLVVDGEDRTGKSYGIRLAAECRSPDQLALIDVDTYATWGQSLHAGELARQIIKDDQGFPVFDPTKESEAVPRLLSWLENRLSGSKTWIIIDHCKRKAITDSALSLLKMLACRIEQGYLRDVRLILVDFDREEFPRPLRDHVRYDRAKLPNSEDVKQWCESLATVAKRIISPDQAEQWAGEVFLNLEDYSRDSGDWYIEFENRLRAVFDKIRACEVKP